MTMPNARPARTCSPRWTAICSTNAITCVRPRCSRHCASPWAASPANCVPSPPATAAAGRRLSEMLCYETVLAPGAYDGVSVKALDASGFTAGYVSGAAVSAAALGQPDLGYLGLAEIAEQVRRMTAVSDIALIVDGDTGYGGVLQVGEAVTRLERAGAAAIQFEDQVGAQTLWTSDRSPGGADRGNGRDPRPSPAARRIRRPGGPVTLVIRCATEVTDIPNKAAAASWVRPGKPGDQQWERIFPP